LHALAGEHATPAHRLSVTAASPAATAADLPTRHAASATPPPPPFALPGAGDDAAAAGDAAGDAQGGGGAGGGGFDLVHLCATFSVDPSIMAFAQLVKALREALMAAPPRGEKDVGVPRGLAAALAAAAAPRARGRARAEGAELLAFCYSALYECITGA
jgi:hypothetical protein